MKLESEKCKCKSQFPIVLQYHLTGNALVCSNCNLDKEIELSNDLNKEISSWNQAYNRVYKIWLGSDKTIKELVSPSSILNKQGFRVIKELNTIYPAYYWWHVNEGEQFDKCPKCRGHLVIVKNRYTGFHKICNKCRILINDSMCLPLTDPL